jgi:hypothetical protein
MATRTTRTSRDENDINENDVNENGATDSRAKGPAPIRTVTVGPGISPDRPHDTGQRTPDVEGVRGLSPPVGNYTQPRRGIFSCAARVSATSGEHAVG